MLIFIIICLIKNILKNILRSWGAAAAVALRRFAPPPPRPAPSPPAPPAPILYKCGPAETKIQISAASSEEDKQFSEMYFVTGQFYQQPTKGILNTVSALRGGQGQEEKGKQQPSLLELHIADMNEKKAKVENEKKKKNGKSE